MTPWLTVSAGYSDGYVALFVPPCNISVGLYDLFQRVDSINDRFDLARLNQLFEER
jgi:hypothetical protein